MLLLSSFSFYFFFFFFFNDTATTEIYTLSLHDALPIRGVRFPPRNASPRLAPRRRGGPRHRPPLPRVSGAGARRSHGLRRLPDPGLPGRARQRVSGLRERQHRARRAPLGGRGQ